MERYYHKRVGGGGNEHSKVHPGLRGELLGAVPNLEEEDRKTGTAGRVAVCKRRCLGACSRPALLHCAARTREVRAGREEEGARRAPLLGVRGFVPPSGFRWVYFRIKINKVWNHQPRHCCQPARDVKLVHASLHPFLSLRILLFPRRSGNRKLKSRPLFLFRSWESTTRAADWRSRLGRACIRAFVRSVGVACQVFLLLQAEKGKKQLSVGAFQIFGCRDLRCAVFMCAKNANGPW